MVSDGVSVLSVTVASWVTVVEAVTVTLGVAELVAVLAMDVLLV
jgi:hypothetical protein